MTICRSMILSVLLLAMMSFAAHAATFVVTSNADTGDGSFRAALVAASKVGGDHVVIIETPGDIAIDSPLSYTGTGSLSVYGNGQMITATGNHTLFEATQGADLTVNNLGFQGPGGFSIQNRGDAGGSAGGKAIFIDVRDDQTGLVNLTLNHVTVADVANHGIHVSDCNLADDCGSDGPGEGSQASIAVYLNTVSVRNVGQGRFDADGLRIDERGEGSVHAVIHASSFSGVGADGIEIDEGQAGSVIAYVSGSAFTDNGGYCDPLLLKPLMPAVDEGTFRDGQKKETDIPGPVTGSPDDRCFERQIDLYDSGYVEEYEFALDLDDGFDIDEAGPGDLRAEIISSIIDGNLDEGLDFDEEDAGSITLSIIESKSVNNTDDGFKHSEQGQGDVFAYVRNSTAQANGSKGFVVEEEDAGNVAVYADHVTASNNDDRDKTGFEVVQDDEGKGIFVVRRSGIADGIDGEGVDIRD